MSTRVVLYKKRAFKNVVIHYSVGITRVWSQTMESLSLSPQSTRYKNNSNFIQIYSLIHCYVYK